MVHNQLQYAYLLTFFKIDSLVMSFLLFGIQLNLHVRPPLVSDHLP